VSLVFLCSCLSLCACCPDDTLPRDVSRYARRPWRRCSRRRRPRPAAAPARPTRGWSSQPLKNIAHQGGGDEVPVQHQYAFRSALEGRGGHARARRRRPQGRQSCAARHDVDRINNGTGTIASHTLKAGREVDGGYWSTPQRSYRHGTARPRPHSAASRPQEDGAEASPPPGGLRVPTLKAVLKAFPHTRSTARSRSARRPEAVESTSEPPRCSGALLKNHPGATSSWSPSRGGGQPLHEIARRSAGAAASAGSADFLLSNKSRVRTWWPKAADHYDLKPARRSTCRPRTSRACETRPATLAHLAQRRRRVAGDVDKLIDWVRRRRR